jgi:hypothetical protein
VAATGARAAGYSSYHLGMIELTLGQRDQARADLTRALQTNPAFSPADGPAATQALTVSPDAPHHRRDHGHRRRTGHSDPTTVTLQRSNGTGSVTTPAPPPCCRSTVRPVAATNLNASRRAVIQVAIFSRASVRVRNWWRCTYSTLMVEKVASATTG